MKSILIMLICFLPLRSKELTLRDAQNLLIKNNYDIQVSEVEIKRVTAEVNEARSAYYPSLDAVGSYSYVTEKGKVNITMPTNPAISSSEASSPHISGQNDRTDVGIELSYPFFTGMSRYFNLKSKESLKSVKEKDLNALKNRYTFTLGLIYLSWNLSYKQLEVRSKSVEQMTRYSEQMRLLYKGGVAVLSKVLESEAKSMSAQLDYILMRNQADSVRRELFGLIKISDTSFVPQSSEFTIDTMEIPRELMISRPELAIYDKNVEQLKYTKKFIMAQRCPMVITNIGYKLGNPGLNTGVNAFMDYFQFGVQTRWNIFDGMKNRAQRAQVQQQIIEIELNKEKSIDEWNRLLEFYKQQISSSDERIAVAEASLDAAEKLMVEIKKSLRSGVVTNADYLLTVTGFMQSELQVEQAKFNKRVTLLNALYASGKNIVF